MKWQDAIKDLIQTRFEARLSQDEQAEEDHDTRKRPSANGSSHHDDAVSTSPEPARKKAKRSSSAEDADARLAAQLQAQENSLARGRSTRGGGTDKKAVKKKKAPRKKSAKKVNSDDDSDVEGAEPKKKRAGGGFQKPFNLSPALSELTGETQVCFVISLLCNSQRARARHLCSRFIKIPTRYLRLTVISPAALTPWSCQESLGTHQGKRSPGPKR